MLRTRMKMCGMTRVDDVIAACEAGADAIGMVFYPGSPRCVSIAQAAELVKHAHPLTQTVGLFVDADVDFIKDVIAQTQINTLQFHGDETEAFCQQFGMPYIKALRVKNEAQMLSLLDAHSQAPAILLDAYVEGVPGGTGECFDWRLIPDSIKNRLLLAGGLNPGNVAGAIQAVQPMAVDVSGGLELSKGVKSQEKIIHFAQQVQRADYLVSEISS